MVTETVFARCTGDRIMAVDRTSRFPAPVRDLRQTGYMRALAPEGLVGPAPDLLLLSDQVGPAALGLDRAPLAALRPMRAVFVLSAARLLDEPTASLDARHRVELLSLLRRLAAQGFAVLVVLHDLNEAAFVADRVAVLAETRLAALGATREVPWPVLLEQAFGVAFRDLDGVLAPAFAA